jgi:hypothetical protein
VLARPANLLTSREAMSPWSALFFLVMKFWFGRRGGGIEWVCVCGGSGGERRARHVAAHARGGRDLRWGYQQSGAGAKLS